MRIHLIRLLLGSLILLFLALGLGGYVLYQVQHPVSSQISKSVSNTLKTPTSTSSEAIKTTPGPVRIQDGIDLETGFIAKGDFEIVRTTCTACHSARLVLQNRATREGWKEMIVWMQETQKLWDLGANEELILDYLATYYGPVKKGRRAHLEIEEWYQINP